MPKELHRKLAKEAKKKHLSGEKKDAYVYGTMNKIENKMHKSKSVANYMKSMKGC